MLRPPAVNISVFASLTVIDRCPSSTGFAAPRIKCVCVCGGGGGLCVNEYVRMKLGVVGRGVGWGWGVEHYSRCRD